MVLSAIPGAERASMELAPSAGSTANQASVMMALSATSPRLMVVVVGYAIWNEDKCKRENPDLGCEKWGAIWYPKCRANFHNVACCICSPDCPPGQTDIGISCAKDSYGRGAGYPLKCKPDQEMSGLLCYPPCKEGYSGNGPVCW